MEIIRERAREFLPQVLLTVLSIIQALALEVLWSRIGKSDHLWNGGLAAVVGWIQVMGVFLGIVVMWLFYVSVLLRFRWTPNVRDSVVPFFLGALEFAMAEILAPEYLSLWCYLLATIFLGASITSNLMIRDALRDEAGRGLTIENDRSLRDRVLYPAAFVGTLMAAGVSVQWAGPDGWVAVLAVVAANAVLLVQAAIIRYYWNRQIKEA